MTLISSVTQWVWPIVIALVVILVLAIVIWWVKTRNAFVMLSHNVEEGFSTIDVSLKKRYDLIPNLVETVKGYATHEKETLSAVMSARSMALNAKSPDEKIAAEKQLGGAIRNIIAVAEAYPQLKADAQFIMLQQQLATLENEISQHRKYYNGVVKQFNNKLLMFPSNIVGKSMHLEKKPFFEIEEAQRENVQVKF